MADPATHTYTFDVEGARKAGYSDAEIASFLGRQSDFDVEGARKAGYGDAEIIAHLAASPIRDGGYITKNMTPAQAKAETDAANLEGKVSGPEKAAWQGLTGNFGDELDGALAAGATGLNNLGRRMTGQPDVGYGMSDAYHAVADQARSQLGAYEKEHPYIAAASELGGAMLSPTTKLGAGFAGRGASALSRTLRSGAAGAMTGAVYGAGAADGDLEDRARGAMTGAVTGAVAGAGLGGTTEAGGAVLAKPAAPTLEQLTSAKNAAYKAVDDSGIVFKPKAFNGLIQDMGRTLDDNGFHAGLHPKTAAMMERLGSSMRDTPGYAPTLTELDQLRQQIGRDLASSSDAGERRMGQILRGKIDDFIDNATPAQLSGGDPSTAAQLLGRARDLNTRVAKLQSLDQLEEAASDRASVTGSGGNGENTLRQNVLRFKRDTKNLTPEEAAATQTVIDGTPIQNGLRLVGKLSPEGNGLMTAGHVVALLPTHGVSGAFALGGAISKRVAEAIAERNVDKLRAIIANGGPDADEALKALAATSGEGGTGTVPPPGGFGRLMTGVGRAAAAGLSGPAATTAVHRFAPAN